MTARDRELSFANAGPAVTVTLPPPPPVDGGSPPFTRTNHAAMGSLKKRRKTKINKHKRKKRMRANRHKKRLRYKS